MEIENEENKIKEYCEEEKHLKRMLHYEIIK